MKNNKNLDVVNYDKEGNVIKEAFPISNRTKRDQSKTSVGYTLISVLLHILAFVPIVAVSLVLAIKCYQLVPYYTIWPFVGVIIAGVFGIIFTVVVLCVTRKKSKSNIAMQTAKIAIAFTCLTTVFALLLTYIVPDVISMATQNTLFVEDLYYNGDAQAEKNAKLDRDFIMYNLLNGNLNDHKDTTGHGDFSYKTLSARSETQNGVLTRYLNADIEASYREYLTYNSESVLQRDVLNVMKANQPRKYELYEFIYKTYVLNDFDYALMNSIERRAFALAILDYEYENANYEALLKEGFKNKKIKQLFDTNFDNFNHDGYQTFDDPLLLYAQMDQRMTIPVVLRLILNEGWSYSQGAIDMSGNIQYSEQDNFLYEMYDAAAKDDFVKKGGEFTKEGTLLNVDGSEYKAMYGYNEDGWMVFENGVVKRPMDWLVLDMLGDPMDLTSIDINSSLGGLLGGIIPGGNGDPIAPEMVGSVLANLLKPLGKLIDSLGGLLKDDVGNLIVDVTGGAKLNINICINDDGALAISISPMNAQYGMLGYMQASWVQSNNLLMAVINVVGLRNWLCIFGAVGVVLVIAAGICRECGRRTRLRTATSRDRIARAKTAQRMADGEFSPTTFDEHELLAAGLTAADIAEIEAEQQNSKAKKSKSSSEDGLNIDDIDLNDLDNLDLTDEELALLADEDLDEKPKKKRREKKKKADDIDDLDLSNLDNLTDEELALLADEDLDEKPKKKRHEKKKKADDIDDLDLANLDNLTDEELALLADDEVEEEKPKKKRFGKKEKAVEDDLDNLSEEELALLADDEVEEEKPKKKRFVKKEKAVEDDLDNLSEEELALLAGDELEEEKPKKKRFGKKNKDIEFEVEDIDE